MGVRRHVQLYRRKGNSKSALQLRAEHKGEIITCAHSGENYIIELLELHVHNPIPEFNNTTDTNTPSQNARAVVLMKTKR